nr:reverse transcriptase domain-containing protein [Tanacetum cinerariifolium]
KNGTDQVRYSRSKSNVSRVNTNAKDVFSKTDDRIDKLVDQISNLVVIVNKQVISPAKAIEKTYVTCGGAHAYYDCIATDSNQPSVCAATGLTIKFLCQTEIVTKFHHLVLLRFEETFEEAWERFKEMLRACPHHRFTKLTQIDTIYNGLNENDQDSLNAAAGGNLLSTYNQVAPKKCASNHMAPPGFAPVQNSQNSLPSNTILNPKGKMKEITTCSGVTYEGPLIPNNPKKVVERETEETTDKEQTNFQGSTAHIQPPVVPILKPDVPKTLPKPNIPYPSRLNDQKLREKAMN